MHFCIVHHRNEFTVIGVQFCPTRDILLLSALGYFDAYTCERMPTNLLQAQRDYFGAHTYERIDREGKFHTEWTGNE